MKPKTLFDLEETLLLESQGRFSWVGCYIGNYYNNLKDKITTWSLNVIDENDLIDIEDKPHVTLKYGLVTQQPKEVEDILRGYGVISCKFDVTGVFQTPEKDILFLHVISDDFENIHELLTNSLNNQQTHKKYIPHLTLASVKKGAGEKYAGRRILPNVSLAFSQVSFTNVNKKRTVISLRGLNATT